MEQNAFLKNLVGPVVRAKRLEAGLSQDALAAKLQRAGWDVSRAGVSKVEARLRRVNDAEVFVLAKVLGCEVHELFPANQKDLAKVLRQGRGE